MLNDTWQIIYNKIYSKVFQFLFIEITSTTDYPEPFVTRFERVSHNLKNCIYYKKDLTKYLPYYHLISILPRILRHKLIQDINRGFFGGKTITYDFALALPLSSTQETRKLISRSGSTILSMTPFVS